eukprot:s1935_g12.t1
MRYTRDSVSKGGTGSVKTAKIQFQQARFYPLHRMASKVGAGQVKEFLELPRCTRQFTPHQHLPGCYKGGLSLELIFTSPAWCHLHFSRFSHLAECCKSDPNSDSKLDIVNGESLGIFPSVVDFGVPSVASDFCEKTAGKWHWLKTFLATKTGVGQLRLRRCRC